MPLAICVQLVFLPVLTPVSKHGLEPLGTGENQIFFCYVWVGFWASMTSKLDRGSTEVRKS